MDLRKLFPRSVAAFLLLALHAVPAMATNFEICVANNADLKSALNEAQFSPVTAKVARGTYDLKNTVWHDYATSVGQIHTGSQILGGYASDCSTRDIASGNTTFTDSVAANDGPFVLGNLTVEGITFSLDKGRIEFIAGDPGLFSISPGSTVELRRDTFLNGAADDVTGVYWYSSADANGVVRVVDSLFVGNSAQFCTMFVQVPRGNPKVEFINNTVVDNHVTLSLGYGSICFTDQDGSLSGDPTFYVYNNIFFGTTGAGAVDLYSDTNQVVLNDNIIGTRNTFTPILSSGELSVDPKLDANHRPVEVPPSPAINSGNNSVPDGLPSSDLDGGARIVGSIVDRGAYESGIDPHPVQTVTKTVDDGSPGTLRAAINSVNSNGGGTIKFNIGSGCGPHVITVSAANGELPGLIADATINGYSQTGASKNTLDVGSDAEICVILEAGTGAGAPTRGLVVPQAASNGVAVTIEGLGFSGFSTAAVDLQGGSQHSVLGNHFGGSVNGHVMQPNGINVRLAANTHDDAVGSDDVADRNILGDATGSSIVVLSGVHDNQIIGNYIGLGWSGTAFTNLANGTRGIFLAGDNNTVSGNLIGNNAQAGIQMDALGAHFNLVENNFIGADAVGATFGNGAAGIRLSGDSSGSGDAPNDNTIRLNTIANNTGAGVRIDVGQRNRVRKNAIFSNGSIGIDLGGDGVDNQTDDGGLHQADEPNRTQNYPSITGSAGGFESGTISGLLATTQGDYTVDFYNGAGCDGSGNGEGKVWLGAATVTVPPPSIGFQGVGSFNALVHAPDASHPLLGGSRITATATDANGNTSEFSVCSIYSNDTLFADGFQPSAG